MEITKRRNMDRLAHLIQHIPLIGLVAARAKGIAGTRMIDGILIAVISSAIAAGVATWATATMNSHDIQNLAKVEKEHHAEVMDEIRQIKKDVYRPR